MKSETIRTKECQSQKLNNIPPKNFKDSNISGTSHSHDEKETCLQSAGSTGNKNKDIIQNKYAFENVEDEILHKNKLFLRNKKIAPTCNIDNTSDF